jgi:hypothetical protein
MLGIRIRLQIRIQPFSHEGVERTQIMFANKILTQNFSKKLNFLRLKMPAY